MPGIGVKTLLVSCKLIVCAKFNCFLSSTFARSCWPSFGIWVVVSESTADGVLGSCRRTLQGRHSPKNGEGQMDPGLADGVLLVVVLALIQSLWPTLFPPPTSLRPSLGTRHQIGWSPYPWSLPRYLVGNLSLGWFVTKRLFSFLGRCCGKHFPE